MSVGDDAIRAAKNGGTWPITSPRGDADARVRQLEADLASLRFSEREWRDKAQDKIAEVESLEATITQLRGELSSKNEALAGLLKYAEAVASGFGIIERLPAGHPIRVARAALSTVEPEYSGTPPT